MNATKLVSIYICFVSSFCGGLATAGSQNTNHYSLIAVDPLSEQMGADAKPSQASNADHGSPMPKIGNATIYVYRKRDVYKLYQPLVFVNNDWLARMDDSAYTRIEVPPGTVEIATTGHYFISSSFRPDLLRISGTGCDGVDLGHLVEAQHLVLKRCADELTGDAAKLATEQGKSRALGLCAFTLDSEGSHIYAGLSIPDCIAAIYQALALIHYASTGEFKFFVDDNSGHHGFQDVMEKPLRFSVEAGHTYYVKFSLNWFSAFTTMKLVDTATWAKENKGLELTPRPPLGAKNIGRTIVSSVGSP